MHAFVWQREPSESAALVIFQRKWGGVWGWDRIKADRQTKVARLDCVCVCVCVRQTERVVVHQCDFAYVYVNQYVL